jgi:predicted RNase H-like HicB family nuclease
MDLSIKIWQKNNEYVASCPELDVHCFGPDQAKATERLKSVIQFYFDSAQDMNQQENPNEAGLKTMEKMETLH